MGEQDYLYVREPGGVRIEVNTGGYRLYMPDWETVRYAVAGLERLLPQRRDARVDVRGSRRSSRRGDGRGDEGRDGRQLMGGRESSRRRRRDRWAGRRDGAAQRGVDVEIVELNPKSEVYGVGINQPGNSLRALDAIGLAEEAVAAGLSR